MILSHTQIEEITAAVIKGFNEFCFRKHAAFETYYAQATPINQLAGDIMVLKQLCWALCVSRRAAVIRLRQMGCVEGRPHAESTDPLEMWA